MPQRRAAQNQIPANTRFGVERDADGAWFRLYSEHAQRIELCLFDGMREQRLPMQREGNIWSVHANGVTAGQQYGYRVDGPWDPAQGLRFNPHKLLLDPYAKSIQGDIDWQDAVYAYQQNAPEVMDAHDNASLVPRSIVVDDGFDWQDDCRPAIPLCDSIVYELHIKGFTRLHPEVPEADRGTYLGLAAPAVLRYLQDLGITTVELLPCFTSFTSRRLRRLGLSNYWGYDPVGWFAPDARFARHDAVSEFKQMVRALHGAGIEVVLDVVFNHTGEEDDLGPNLSLRGIDNAVYYRLLPDAARYRDFTGCGNSVNTAHPQVMRMLIDSLRYWVEEMHVDGFRFDLATTVMRGGDDRFEADGELLRRIGEDPLLSQVKLIAEPWDLGGDGYQLGRFPPRWAEWNDRFRDTMRAYWSGAGNTLPEFSRRFTASADLFAPAKQAFASVNFITAHDGFTLRDLVSYERKHNQANGEDNRDGHNHNLSRNYGVEGPGDDPQLNALRLQQQRNLLASLLLSHGVPMLLAGDERSRSQQGNNNAYCQDNEINWLDWAIDTERAALHDFVRLLISLRQQHAVFRPVTHVSGELRASVGYRDIEWLRPDGRPMSGADWAIHYARFIGVLLTAAESGDRHFLLLCNAGDGPVDCVLPQPPADGMWQTVFDTALWPHGMAAPVGTACQVGAYSTVLMMETEKT